MQICRHVDFFYAPKSDGIAIKLANFGIYHNVIQIFRYSKKCPKMTNNKAISEIFQDFCAGFLYKIYHIFPS